MTEREPPGEPQVSGSAEDNKVYRCFHDLCVSFALGFANFASAQSAYKSLKLVILSAVARQKDERMKIAIEELELKKVTRYEFERFVYVSDSSHLIYLTALFDTLLTDVTKFLIYRIPGPYESAMSVTYEEVIKAGTYEEVRRKLVDDKARSLSRQSFLKRLRELRKSYKLDLKISNDDRKNLEKIAGIRNAIAHDHSFVDFSFDDTDNIQIKFARDPNQPIDFEESLLQDAWVVYIKMFKEIYLSVTRQVIKDFDEESDKRMVSMLDAVGQPLGSSSDLGKHIH